MATLKRSDILRKHANRGRPPKPEKERQLKQRAAYQWRDARRVYLAASFERWRKLRSRLQLKDSSLAWHLLETHDKGCYDCSLQDMNEEESSFTEVQDDAAEPPKKKDPSKFHPALVMMLNRLCHSHLNFEDCVELVGLICVETDHKTKKTYSIKELVKRGLLPKQRTHERHQADLEASEAEFVAAMLSRCEKGENKPGESAVHSEHDGDDLSNANCDNFTKLVSTNTVGQGSHPSLTAATSVLNQEQNQGTSAWEVVGSSAGTSTAMDEHVPESVSETSLPSQDQFEDVHNLDSGSARIIQSSSLANSQLCTSYDETDHSVRPTLSLHHTDHNSSTSRNTNSTRTHAMPDPWHTHAHHHSSLSCKPGESHKVVLSDDGRVSHVVHNGPSSNEVYRIDLSNHNAEEDVESDDESVVDTEEEHVREEVQVGDDGSRDPGASMESNDSFMEVGIVSKIKHAQDLLASPPASSPVAFPVSQHPSTYPPHSLSSVPLSIPVDSTLPCPEASPSQSHPTHTSVIKQVFSPHHTADVKTEPAPSSSSSSSAFSTGRKKATATAEDAPGDLPLDMSLVKDEVENSTGDGDEQPSDSLSDKQNTGLVPSGEAEANNAHSEQRSTTQDAGLSSTLQSNTTESSEQSQVQQATSSMQLLQHYTDRLLQQHQQQHVNADQSGSHSQLLMPDGDDPTRSRKRKLSDMDDKAEGGESGRGGVPWPRKDMTQKEEYQFLEMDPFMDFAEMSRLFPNMQQRTFYRWKRRIKDQFICVEQQPGLTYAQFSQYFPQVKDHVFDHWLGLIAKGHRFLGDAGKSSVSYSEVKGLTCSVTKVPGREGEGSLSHKEGEGGGHHDDYISQYIFLQKNLSLDLEQFSQVFPEVPQHLYFVWRKQIFSDFLKLQANPKLTYQEFRKQASVTQDVFSLWKAHLTLMNAQSPLMTTCASLVSAASPLSSSTPTLPPVSLLTARAGNKGMATADLAAWYASYGPLMGQMAMPFWPSLSLMSSPPVPTSLSKRRDSSSVEQERDHDPPSRDIHGSETLSEKDMPVKRKAPCDSSKLKDSDQLSKAEPESPSPDMSESGGGGDGVMSHRGRRQSLKPEHYYYLLHPDTTYIALTQLFPGVSAQRYGRWRRKVSSALALLAREPNCSATQFALSFPNVPDEILSSWRDRVKHGHTQLMVAGNEAEDDLSTSNTHPSTSPSPAQSGRHSETDWSLGAEAEETPNFLSDKWRDEDGDKAAHEDKGKDNVHADSPAILSSRKQFKLNREEFHFVQRYPNMDFGTFGRYYSNISVRTFYRWRRQIRDAIDLLRASPSLSFSQFQKLVPEVTEDVFEVWQALVKEEAKDQNERAAILLDGVGEESGVSVDESVPTSSSNQSHQPSAENTADTREVSGQCRPEQWLVHMNPNLDYSELSRSYPHVAERTFYRWKQEVKQVMDYMRNRSDVRYEDIASVLPAVSKEAFLMWQHLLNLEKCSQQIVTKVKAETVSQSVDSLKNFTVPRVVSATSHTVTDSVSQSNYDDSVERDQASSGWLTHVAEQQVGVLGTGGEEEESPSGKGRRQTRDEFIHVMLNPAMDYLEFARRFGTVSQRTFYRWRAHIRDWRAAIRADPHMDYVTFSRMARDVPESVFQVWRDWENRSENPHSTSSSREGFEGPMNDGSQSGTGQGQRSQASKGPVSVEDENWKTSEPSANQLVLCAAYEYYQRHPDILFGELSHLYPSVTQDAFQQWKKDLDMKMEYIRSIPTTNFDDFHSLFADVKEDIFHIWKAKVLGQVSSGEKFVFGEWSGGESSGSMPTQQPAFPTNSSHSFYPQNQTTALYSGSTASQDKGSSLHYSHDGTSGKSSLVSSYQATASTSCDSTHMQPSPAKSEEGLTSNDFQSTKDLRARIKLESSPNTPLPSFTETVSNLGRLNAMMQHSMPSTKQTLTPGSTAHFPRPSPAATISHSPNPNTSIFTSPAGIVRSGTGKASVDTSSKSTHFTHGSRSHSSVPQASSTDGTARFEDWAATGSENRVSDSNKEEDGEERGLEGPSYSSQRQRKLQRIEYMFVEQNPDVDVQEFLNRFPKVSLRTFYRWKREIREEHHGSASATL